MPTIWSRLLALELLAKLNGLRLDYAASQQNGRDCWYVATISMLREKGYPLKGVDARSLRAKSRDWLLARHDEFKLFGEDYWSFIDNWNCAWVTNLAIIAALSVLSEDLEKNLEMVALSTTGSDYHNPVCSESDWAETVRLTPTAPGRRFCTPSKELSTNCVRRSAVRSWTAPLLPFHPWGNLPQCTRQQSWLVWQTGAISTRILRQSQWRWPTRHCVRVAMPAAVAPLWPCCKRHSCSSPNSLPPSRDWRGRRRASNA